MEQGRKWALVAIEGNMKGRAFPVTERGITVGREVGNSLVLQDDNISRRHVELRVQAGILMLIDLGSRNGTYVNNKRISGTLPLKPGDRLALGSHLLEITVQDPRENTMEIEEESEAEKTMISPQAMQDARNFPPAAPLQVPASVMAASKPAPPTVAMSKSDIKAMMRSHTSEFNDESTMRIPSPSAAPAQPAWGGGYGNLASPAPAPLHAPMPHPSRPPAAQAAQPMLSTAPSPMMSQSVPALGLPPSSTPEMAFNPGLVEMDYGAGQMGGYSQPMESASPAGATKNKKTLLFAGIGGVLLLLVVIIGVSVSGSSTPEAPPLVNTGGNEGDTSQMQTSIFSDARTAASLAVSPDSYKLNAEETALSTEERRRLSQEVFDQAVAFADSEKFKEALTEFTHAYALDPQCDLCLLRANKMAQEIKSRVERYNSEALRYFQALKYEQSYQSWEMALLLLDDPESPAGKAIQENMAHARQQHRQQSYR